MKFSIVTSFPYEKGKLTIKDIAKIGYEGVDLSIRNPKGARKQLLNILKKQPLKVVSILTGKSYHLDKLKFSANFELERDQAKKRLEDYIDLAAEIKSSVLIGYIRGRRAVDFLTDAEPIISDYLKKCDEYALKKGVKLLLEPLNRYSIDFINTIDEAFDKIEKLDLKSTFIAADTYHMNIEENKTIDKAILKAGRYLEQIHVSDNNRKIPGEGCLPWENFFSALKKIKYNNFISVEAELGAEPYSAAYKAIKNLRGFEK